MFLLRVLEIKCFEGKTNAYDLIDFARDFRLVKKGDGTLINISKNQAVNEKMKQLTGLTNLDALYLTDLQLTKCSKTASCFAPRVLGFE